jgi:hypothetical protein
VLSTYPTSDSPLRLENFFEALYLRYDERYVYSAPDLKNVTRRLEWSPNSPIFDKTPAGDLPVDSLDYQFRLKALGPDEANEQ